MTVGVLLLLAATVVAVGLVALKVWTMERSGEPVGHEEETGRPPSMQSMTVEMTFGDVSPEVLEILTGGAFSAAPAPTFSVEVKTAIKRTFWEWLTRRPRRYHTVYIPHARLVEGP